MNRIRDKHGNSTENTKDIQNIIRECFINLNSNNLENLREICKFLDLSKSPKLNQEDINNINRFIQNEEDEIVVKSSLLLKQAPAG